MRNSREFEELRDSIPRDPEEFRDMLARMPSETDEDRQAIFDMIDNWAFVRHQER